MLPWKTHWGNEAETVRHTGRGGGRDNEGRAPPAAKTRPVLLCELREHAIYFWPNEPPNVLLMSLHASTLSPSRYLHLLVPGDRGRERNGSPQLHA